MKTILINSPREKTFALSMVGEIEPDGTMEVIIKKIDGSSTAKQRRLRWLWMGEIARSGLGRHDTAKDVDRVCKWEFAIPIFKRDDPDFHSILRFFIGLVYDRDDKPEAWRKFLDKHVSVENMTRAQEAEYLTEVQRFWIGKGVSLTDPSTQGVDLEKIWRS